MHLSSNTPAPPSRRRFDCHSLPPALRLLVLFLALDGLSPCLADSARSSEVPLSPHLVPIRIAPGVTFLETAPPPCARADSALCRRPAPVSFTPDQRTLLQDIILPALFAAFARGPQALQSEEGPAPPLPPKSADVCREVGGSAAGVALYVAPLVGADGAAEAVRCADAVVLRLRPDALDASKTTAAAAPQLSKALGVDGCPDTDAVLLRGVSADGDVRGVCVGLRCAVGERVEVRPTGAAHWTDCAEGLLPIACPYYADVCAAPLPANKTENATSVSTHKPVKKRSLSAFGESDGLTHSVKESAPEDVAKNTTINDATADRTRRSTKSKLPVNTRIKLRHNVPSNGGNALVPTASWALLVLFLAMS